MFEKSLYDLIKGLRNHRGAEDEYIQDCLRECKAEVKSQDMDKKATAVLKLIYLEMFGYDMSWASFHVLEVMSSSKYLQKRVGYVGAAQSFRPDTEVLMLATNLLKKDLTSSNILSVSLPLVTLPHIISPSLAMSLLPDILARLSHSHAATRKKAIVSLYRLALVYPDALKLAWPRIKDRLMDIQEDGSVTTAVINVVCELGWRRPGDFLPLAPRFFDLLVEGGNNWMAIKIIKLFAALTSVEPRLVRKLLRPLTNIIQTTTAMSLLYECINGIIQGGILDGDDNLREKDEIASLCVGKLRGMIVMDADPNLKYVALLAFNRIVTSHPTLVYMQQDVITDCLDDEDVSIRLQALELAVGMVTSETLQFVVNRLVDQLRNSSSGYKSQPSPEDPSVVQLSSDYGLEESAKLRCQKTCTSLPLLGSYKIEVLHRILDICSRNNYSELPDFEWYIDILVQLVSFLPQANLERYSLPSSTFRDIADDFEEDKDISSRMGSEIRNVAVRVKSVRMEATRAAESLLLNRRGPDSDFNPDYRVLGPIAWVVGEYAEFLAFPERTLRSLIDISNVSLPIGALSLYLQAIPKVFIHFVSDNTSGNTEVLLFLTRIIEFLEALSVHPDLDIQERSIEFLEILRLAAEALRSANCQPGDMPLLLSSVIPGLFSGLELNPVALSAQRKVPLPEKLILGQVLNGNLSGLFGGHYSCPHGLKDRKIFHDYYYSRDAPALYNQFTEPVQTGIQVDLSYQNIPSGPADESAIAKRRTERRERNRDDPFYIGIDDSSGRSTPFYPASTASNGELDVDSIPIIDLTINEGKQKSVFNNRRKLYSRSTKVDVAVDETIGYDDSARASTAFGNPIESGKVKSSLLQVDSSSLKQLSLDDENQTGPFASQNHTRGNDEVDMAKAMHEVEKARLEMQRESERINLQGIPAEGTLIKKKARKNNRKHITAAGSESLGGDSHSCQQPLDSGGVTQKKRGRKWGK